MEAEPKEAGTTHQQPVPELQVILMKLPECGRRSVLRHGVETVPADTAEPAIAVGLTLKAPWADKLRRKLRDRTGRQQRHGYSLTARIETTDSRNSAQKDIGSGRERGLVKDHFVSFEGGHFELGGKTC